MYFGFQDISITYGKRQILHNITMEFEKGKITTIIGPNGCGKSSLFKTVSRVVSPSEGNVIFEGKPIQSYPPKELAKKIAYLPQIHTSPSDIDIRTLVSYGRFPYKKFGGGMTMEDSEIIDQTLELTGLSRMSHRLLNNLSGGEKQRAWIAMTICQQPEILLLDEPAAGLDPRARIELRDILRALADKGKTIFLSSHILSELDDLCDRTIIIEKGQLKKQADLHTHVADTLLLTSALPPAELAEKLRNRPEVQSVTVESKDKLRIVLQAEKTPAVFVAGLITEGIPVTGFEIAREHLEDLFLNATKGEVQ